MNFVGDLHHVFDVNIRIFRDQKDKLGLSGEAMDLFVDQMIDAYKKALLESLERGILPRCVELTGQFTVTGIKKEVTP